MPPLLGLEFLRKRVFYKYFAPTALGFTSEHTLLQSDFVPFLDNSYKYFPKSTSRQTGGSIFELI